MDKMNGKMVDLTQTIHEGIPDWNGCCGFQMNQVMDYPDGACVHEINTPNGIGTHMDAPSHFIEGATDISKIRLEKLVCPGLIIDVRHKATPDYAISAEDISDFEKRYGEIVAGSIVIGFTGWGDKWHSPAKYRNEDDQGIMHFPKFSIESIDYLLKRHIHGIAIDTLSPDGSDYNFPVHHKLLGAGKFIIENIKLSNTLPPTNFTIIALPLKIKQATEAPCRVIAMIEPEMIHESSS